MRIERIGIDRFRSSRLVECGGIKAQGRWETRRGPTTEDRTTMNAQEEWFGDFERAKGYTAYTSRRKNGNSSRTKTRGETVSHGRSKALKAKKL